MYLAFLIDIKDSLICVEQFLYIIFLYKNWFLSEFICFCSNFNFFTYIGQTARNVFWFNINLNLAAYYYNFQIKFNCCERNYLYYSNTNSAGIFSFFLKNNLNALFIFNYSGFSMFNLYFTQLYLNVFYRRFSEPDNYMQFSSFIFFSKAQAPIFTFNFSIFNWIVNEFVSAVHTRMQISNYNLLNSFLPSRGTHTHILNVFFNLYWRYEYARSVYADLILVNRINSLHSLSWSIDVSLRYVSLNLLLICCLYLYIIIFLYILFTAIICFFFSKNIVFGNFFFKKLKQAFDFDFENNDMFFVFFCFFLVFFFLMFYWSYVFFNNFSNNFMFFLLFIFFFCFLGCFLYLFGFGVFFLIYLFGLSSDVGFCKTYVLSFLNIISFFFRFLLQILRLVLISICYFLLHEFFFFDFLYFFSSNNASFFFSDFILTISRFLLESLDFLFLFFIQLSAYLIMLFFFFSFLFLHKVNINYNFWFVNYKL